MFQSRKLDLMATVTTAHTKTDISKMYFYHLCNKRSWKYATIIANMAVLLNSNMATPFRSSKILNSRLSSIMFDIIIQDPWLCNKFRTKNCYLQATILLYLFLDWFSGFSLFIHVLLLTWTLCNDYRKRKTILKLLTSSNSNCKYLFCPPDFTKYKKAIHHSSTTLFYHYRAIKGVKYATILQYMDKKLKAGQTEGS